MIRRCVLLVVLSLTLLTGCWDFREVEHLIYLNALGVDYDNGKYILYTQTIDFSNLSKLEGGGGRNPEKSSIAKGIGDTFDQAAFDLYKTAQQKISWAHISALVFTERAVRAQVPAYAIDLMRRYHEMRHTIWTFGTKAQLDELFAVTPMLNISTVYSRLNHPEDNFQQSSQIAPVFLNKFISSLNEQPETTILPYLSISKTRVRMGKKPHDMLQIDGVGVILNNKYKGFVGEKDLYGLRWVEPKHKRMALFTYYQDKALAGIIFHTPKVKVIPSVEGGKLYFDLKIKCKGSILEIVQHQPEKIVQEVATKQMEHEIRHTFEEGIRHHSDILNLGLHLYRKQPETWHRFQKNELLPLAPESLRKIEINLLLETSGKLKLE